MVCFLVTLLTGSIDQRRDVEIEVEIKGDKIAVRPKNTIPPDAERQHGPPLLARCGAR